MRPQINALTSTRAVAAIMVVIHHFGESVFPFNRFPKVFHSGNIAVGYFFVLSGFVLYYSYHNVRISYTDYIKKRIARIVPVYLLALFFFVFVVVRYYDTALDKQLLKETILSAAFLQAYVPGYPLCLNSPGWTISVEMLFYLLFPVCLMLLNKNIRVFVLLAIILFIGAQFFHAHYYTQRWTLEDGIIDTVFFNPVMHLNQFLIGMIGGYIYGIYNGGRSKCKWISPLLLIVIYVLVAFRPDNISYHVGLIAPIFMLFILSVAIADHKFLKFKLFVFLGEISYGIYILQRPVYKFIEALNTRHTHVPQPWFFYITFIILLVVATLSYYFFEKPLRRKINSLKFNKAA